MRIIKDLFTESEVTNIRELPEVSTAYKKLLIQNNVYFSIPASDLIKQRFLKGFDLNLESISTIPCRWIQGDTPSHIDRGQSSFEDTYLIYLTDGEGQFKIQDEEYPIKAGTGFSFSEGVSHEVTGTNGTSRLLLGPMSEFGFAVGANTNISGGGGTFAYIRNNSGTVEYSYDNSTWNTILFPCGVENTNTSAGYFQILFTTDITLSSTNDYFFIQSEKIQFGSTSLKSDGTRPVITIDVDNYPGLIENGTSATSGYNDIRVYNLYVDGTGYDTTTGGGWIGRGYYGNAASGCSFLNCKSSGSVAQDGGGISGYYTGSSSGSVTFLGCSSDGSLAVGAGGIAGANCDGITCTQCYSEGSIGQNAGGILGLSAGGSCSATKCYSTGTMALGAGGIIGASAVDGVSASQCYSTGTIGTSAGGIFGNFAATTTATNCYSTGTIGTSAGGIFGNPFGNPGTRTATNCYSANGSWSDATANLNLQQTPTGSPGVGTIWSSTGTNTPYELTSFGATPYQTQVIQENTLVQSRSQTVEQGQTSISAVKEDPSGNSFSILEKTGGDSGSYDTIVISGETGGISTTVNTAVGTYTIYVRSVGSYQITTFQLTVTQAPSTSNSTGVTNSSCCTLGDNIVFVDYAFKYKVEDGNILIANTNNKPANAIGKPISYMDMIKMKMAQASKTS